MDTSPKSAIDEGGAGVAPDAGRRLGVSPAPSALAAVINEPLETRHTCHSHRSSTRRTIEERKAKMSTQTLTSDIRAVIEEWADALRNKDATRMLFHYAPLVFFSLAPPLLSTASNAEGLKCVVRHLARPNRLRNPRPGYHDRRDVAFSHSLNRMHGTKTDGAKADFWFRQTFGFQRIKGEWKIAGAPVSTLLHGMAASKPRSNLAVVGRLRWSK